MENSPTGMGDVGVQPAVQGTPWGEEARMRAFAIQFLYLLRVHVADAAPPEVWDAVEKLEGALRCERWPELGEDWKAVGLTRFWEDVSRAVSRSPGPKLRRYEILDAVSAAMKAVSSGRNADRNASKANGALDHQHNLLEISMFMGDACRIATDFEVPPPFLEAVCVLTPAISP